MNQHYFLVSRAQRSLLSLSLMVLLVTWLDSGNKVPEGFHLSVDKFDPQSITLSNGLTVLWQNCDLLYESYIN